MLLKAPECGAQLAAQILEDAVPGEMFQLLLESQSSRVHPALARKILARAALYNLVLPTLEDGLGGTIKFGCVHAFRGICLPACLKLSYGRTCS